MGLGICLVDVPHATTPYTAVYWAKSICPIGNLPPRLAKGLVSARTFGRSLPPFVPISAWVDTLTVWADSAPQRSLLEASPPPGPHAAELVQEVREVFDQAFLHSSLAEVMLHWPGGAPIELTVSRFHTRAAMELAASQATWPLRFHADVCLHCFGALPRGTDTLLHLAVEFDGLCGATTTLFLLDGRALSPTGPPFRTALLPRSVSGERILETARTLFPEALRASALRINGRLLSQWDVGQYSFPLVRLLPSLDVGPPTAFHDWSCLPAEPFLALFPALALEQQSQTCGILASDSVANTVEVMQVPPRSVANVISEADPVREPIPFVLDLPPLNPFVEQVEVVVLSLHFQTFRLWVPVLITMPRLRQAISHATGQDIVMIRWPRIVPRIPGRPLFLIAATAGSDPRATLGIVDARPVHPLSGPVLWLVALPERMQSQDLTSMALAERQIIRTPFCTKIDGKRCLGSLSFRKGSSFLRSLLEVHKKTLPSIGNTPGSCRSAFSLGRTNTAAPRPPQQSVLLLGSPPVLPLPLPPLSRDWSRESPSMLLVGSCSR